MTTDIKEIHAQRSITHGDFEKNSLVTQEILLILSTEGYYKQLDPVMREALHMIVHKIARICCGDCTHKDSWVDIAGYSQLIVQALEKYENYNIEAAASKDFSEEIPFEPEEEFERWYDSLPSRHRHGCKPYTAEDLDE